jgi:hypothetical protein
MNAALKPQAPEGTRPDGSPRLMNRRVPSPLRGLRAASGLIEIITLFTALTLDDEHAVAIAVKPVVFADGLSVGFFDEIQTGEGGDHHQQG